MVALPFFQPDETPDDYEPPTDFDPATAPPFDYDAPHYVLRHEGNVPQDKRLTLAPMTLSRGAQPNGMLPGKEPTLDPATAGDAWATNELSEGGVPTHYVFPTRPGDRPADDETGFLGDAAERYQKTGDHYGGFDNDERAAEFMRLHSKPKTFFQNLLEGVNLGGENLAAQSPEAREAGKTMARGAEDLASSAVNQLKPGPAAQRIIDAAAKGFSGDAAERGEKYGGPLMGFRPGDEKVNARAYQWLKDNGLDPSNMGLLQQTARYLTDVGIGSARLGMGGLDLTGRLFSAALHGGGQAVTERLLSIGVSKDTAERVGDTIGQVAEMFAIKGENPFHGVAPDARIGQEFDKGIINRSGRPPVDLLRPDPARPLIPSLLNTPSLEFQNFARERAAQRGLPEPDFGEADVREAEDKDPRFQQRRADNANVWSVENPMFFSAVEDVIKNGDSKAPPDDWYNRIKRTPGIKEEELETIGLRGWIDEQKAAGRKSIPRQEILDWVQAHNVEIEETVLGGYNPRVKTQYDRLKAERRDLHQNVIQQQQDIMDTAKKERENLLAQHQADSLAKDRELMDAGRWQEANELLEKRNEAMAQVWDSAEDIMARARDKAAEVQDKAQDQYDAIDAQINDLRPRVNNPQADYSGYAHPGENYRIVLLRLKRPKADTGNVDAARQASSDAYQALVNELHRTTPGLDEYDIRGYLRGVQDGSAEPYKLADLRRLMPDTADSLIDNAQKTYAQLQAEAAKQPRPFTESHWPAYPDIIAHYRLVDVVDPVTGEKRTVVVEQQSDIHQKAAKGRGYEGVTNTPAAKAAAQKALGDATANLKQEQSRIAQAVSEGRYTSKEDLFLDGTDAERRAFQTQELEDAAHKNADKALRKAQEQVVTASGAHPAGRPLPNLPYKQTEAWTTLIAKSVLRRAAEENLGKVSFDVGQTNVDRYENYLIKHINQITYNPLPDGRFELSVKERNGHIVGDMSKPYTVAEVAEKFGDDVARSMIDRVGDKDIRRYSYEADQDTSRPEFGQPYVLRNINKTTGHEGMLEYYDRIGRKAWNTYLKKWKVQLDDNDTIQTGADNWEIEHDPGRDPEPQLRDDIPEEDPDHPDYDPDYERTEDDYYYNDDDYEPEQWVLHRNNRDHEYYDSESEAQDALAEKLEDTTVRTLDIPDALKKDVMEKGQPRFQQRRTGQIIPALGARSFYDRTTAGRITAELAFTPEMMAQRVALARDLRQRLDALGLHDIAIRVADAVYAIGKDGLRVPDINSDGYYLHQIINVALSDDPMGTLNHEVIHAMRDLGLFNKKEWKLLEDAADQYWRKHHKIADAYGHLSDAGQREEAIAFAFSKWAKDRAAASQGTFVQQAMKRVQDFIAVVKNGLTRKGFHTVDSIFKNIDTGKIGQRNLLERGLINTDDVAFQHNVLHRQEPFYSEWERFLENPQTQNKASPDDWLNILNKKNWTDPKDPAKTVRGLKPEEIDQTGVREWIERQKASGVTSIPKQQVFDYVKEHNVEIEPLLLGGSDPKLQTEIDDLLKQKSVILADEDQYKQAGKWPDAVKQMEAFDQRIADLKQEQADNPNPPIKHEQYRLGNRANNLNAYQAMLLILKRKGTAAGERIVAEAERAKLEAYNRMIRAQTEAGVNRWDALDRVKNLRAGRWDTDWEIEGLENLLGKDAADRLITDYQDAYRAHTAAEHKYPPHPPFTYNIHWSQADFLAHFRFETRYINGKKILYVIEGQSDWHQQGQKFGYQGIHNTSAALNEAVVKNTQAKVALEQEGNRLAQQVSNGRYKTKQELMYSDDIDDARDLLRLELTDPAYKKAAQARMAAADEQTMTQRAQNRAVPNAPFKDTDAWTTLMLKHINRFAAENHYDRVSFDVGQTHADRYPGLERHVKQIKYTPNRDGTFDLQMQDDSGGRLHDQGTTVYNRNWTLPEIAKLFGPEVASKMISRDGVPWGTATGVPLRDEYIPRTLQGIDKKVGIEGMKYSYDNILPKNLKTYLKPWKVDIDRTTTMPYNDWKLVAPDPMYGNARWYMEDDNYHTRQFGTEAEARAAHEAETKHAPTFSYDLTPKMVEDVMKGQARFKRRATPYRGLINRTYH